jgi:ligand-binding sensor protein
MAAGSFGTRSNSCKQAVKTWHLLYASNDFSDVDEQDVSHVICQCKNKKQPPARLANFTNFCDPAGVISNSPALQQGCGKAGKEGGIENLWRQGHIKSLDNFLPP